MRQIVLLLFIFVACLQSRMAAQGLSDCTISSCSINTDVLAGTIGEASVSGLVGNGVSLMPGFIEVLLSEALEIPADPTAMEQIEQSVKITAKEHYLTICLDHPWLLTVYKISGELVIREKIEKDFVLPLSSGLYVVILQNEAYRKVYKVNMH